MKRQMRREDGGGRKTKRKEEKGRKTKIDKR